jgi:hypothetical protein
MKKNCIKRQGMHKNSINFILEKRKGNAMRNGLSGDKPRTP